MKKLTFLFLFFALSTLMFAQNKSYSGFKRFNSAGINAIMENNEVKGYFIFGILDKVSSKENLYFLGILDNNLNETHSIELKKSSKLALLESSYNGERFCFSFIDYKAKAIEYLLIDKEGKSTGAYKVSGLSNTEIQIIQAAAQSDDYLYSGGLQSVSGKGFIRYGVDKEKGYRISLEMFDNAGKLKWTAKSGVPLSQKSYESAVPLYSDASNVISILYSRTKLFDQSMASDVICHDAVTGKEKFRISSSSNPKYNRLPVGALYDEVTDEFYVYGEFAKPKDIVSLGMYIQIVDKEGKIKKESYSSWTGEIFAATPGTIKNKMEKNMFVAIHKIIRTADGKFFAIGEQFKKGVSGLGIASAVLNGGQGGVALVKIEVHNMMVYEFDANLKIKNVDMIEKDKTNVQLPQGSGVNGTTTLGYYLRQYGQFDYAYTAISTDRKKFNSAYVNYDRDKEEGNKFIVGNISYTGEQKLATDKVDLSSKATSFWLKPSKPGYVCIFEYYRKAKKLDVRLEKLNL